VPLPALRVLPSIPVVAPLAVPSSGPPSRPAKTTPTPRGHIAVPPAPPQPASDLPATSVPATTDHSLAAWLDQRRRANSLNRATDPRINGLTD
jgi:hypothetical protein